MKEHEKHEKHRAKGGKVDGDLDEPKDKKANGYTPKDVPVMKEAEEDKDSFKRGGRAKKRKDGGKAEGHKPMHRLDKRASGGKVGGHSPLTMAAKVEGRPGGKYDGGDSIDREAD